MKQHDVRAAAAAGGRVIPGLITAVAVPPARLRDWAIALVASARGELAAAIKSLLTVAGVALLIGAAEYASGAEFGYVPVAFLFLVSVAVAVLRWGIVAGIVAVIAGRFVVAYSFYPPEFSIKAMLDDDVSDVRLVFNLATLGILLVGIVRHQAAGAARRESELRQLYTFSRRLMRANSAAEILAAVQAHLAAILEREVVLLRPEHDMLACIPAGAVVPSSVRTVAADLLSTRTDALRTVADARSHAKWLVRPVSSNTTSFGAIAVKVGRDGDASIEKISRQVADALTDAVEALDFLEVERAIQDAKIRSEADQLREAMIGAVSHDLSTPLAAILCSASVLGSVPSVMRDERLSGLVGAIREQAERHSKDIENLLDASRINGNAVRPKFEWTDIADIVNAAVERLSHRRGPRTVDTRLPEDLPLVRVDALLLERALVQVLDNAAKYSDPRAPIAVAAEKRDEHVVLTVSDSGGGLMAAEKTKIWQRFFRGEQQARTTSGLGLGLWVAHAFVAANGGSIEADSAGPGHGTAVSIRLPLAKEAPADMAEGDDDLHD